MAGFLSREIDFSQINNGQRFEDGDGITPNAVNAPIEAAHFAQETAKKVLTLAETQPDVSDADAVGMPNVTIVNKGNGEYQFKFTNLKGESGADLSEDVNKLYQTTSKNDKRISNLEAKISNDAFITDTDISYQKIVPADVAPYAEIVKVGGMSYRDEETNTIEHAKVTEIKSAGKNLAFIKGWSAQNTPSNFKTTNDYGTTISATTGNAITVTQSKQDNPDTPHDYQNGYLSLILNNRPTQGKRYKLSFDITVKENPLSVDYIYMMPCGRWQGAAYVMLSGNAKQRISANFPYYRDDSADYDYLEFRCCGMSFDIGNVMITREEVTDITYTPAVVLDTLAIPEVVRNLEGFGLGISAEIYNHIKYTEDGKVIYVQKCKEDIFYGTETWKEETFSSGLNFYCDRTFFDAVANSRVVCNHYQSVKDGSSFVSVRNNAFLGATKKFNVTADYYSGVPEWRGHLTELYEQGNPLKFVYELAEPIETDITDLMPIDNSIKVQGGGYITADNDYEYAVPTEILYQKRS